MYFLLESAGIIIFSKEIFFDFEIPGDGGQASSMVWMKMAGNQIIDFFITTRPEKRRNDILTGIKSTGWKSTTVNNHYLTARKLYDL